MTENFITTKIVNEKSHNGFSKYFINGHKKLLMFVSIKTISIQNYLWE